MLKKEERQRAILNLIESRDISTQEELCALLEEAGFPATQATVSRDIRELSLSKMPSDETGQKYVRIRMSESDMDEKYSRVLRDGYVAMDILCLKPFPEWPWPLPHRSMPCILRKYRDVLQEMIP